MGNAVPDAAQRVQPSSKESRVNTTRDVAPATLPAASAAQATRATQAAEVPVEALSRRCDPDSLGFETTADVKPLDGAIGQPRAVRAIEFGLAVADDAYHLFVVGPPG